MESLALGFPSVTSATIQIPRTVGGQRQRCSPRDRKTRASGLVRRFHRRSVTFFRLKTGYFNRRGTRFLRLSSTKGSFAFRSQPRRQCRRWGVGRGRNGVAKATSRYWKNPSPPFWRIARDTVFHFRPLYLTDSLFNSEAALSVRFLNRRRLSRSFSPSRGSDFEGESERETLGSIRQIDDDI